MALCDLMYVVDGGTKKAGTVDTSRAKLAVIMGTAATVGTLTLLGVFIEIDGKAKSGYMKKSDVDALNPTSIAIPANFAGLEAEMTPTRLQDQLFRIETVVENEDYVEVTARHVWYDNIKNFTLWEVPKANKDTDYTAAAICRNILTNAISPVDSRVASDCTDTIKGSDIDYKNKNIVEAFLDPTNGVCAKFDLSLIRDNWDFYVLKNVGYNRGFVVEDGKNLLGVERTESIENLATRVAPFGKDKKGNIVWLNNNGLKYVDSQYIGNYSCPYVELYDTGIQIGKGGVTTQNIQAKLLEAGQKRFTDDHIDLPTVEMTVEFLSLGDTEEYAQYRGLDKVYLYDIITVHDKVRGYSYTAQVVGIEHDILTGMLNSVTIGKLDNWDGTRKIATWQVPEVNGENIRLLSIQAGSFEEGAIYGEDIAEHVIAYMHLASATIDNLTADAITAVTANIQTIIAGKITADSIDTNSISAINAKLGTATIQNGYINNAVIDYARVYDLSAESLIAHDAVTDRYYIHKLAVDNAQMVYATVGELVVKATDNKYYRLDINAQGQLSPTEVTLTAGEITAGITSDGRASIIETDLTVSELSATNMKGISALIDKITASRIDVDELWSRQAFINKLMVQDISSNTYIQATIGNWTSSSTITQTINGLDSRISSLGYGTVYMQPTEPDHENLVAGDIWTQTQNAGTWSEVYGTFSTWEDIYDDIPTWQVLSGVAIMWVWDGNKFQMASDMAIPDALETEIKQNANSITLLATRTTTAEGQITSLSASLEVTNTAITAEVTRATNAESGKLDKTTTYQTADSIVSAAQTYTNGQLENYSTTTQTSNMISAYVTNNAYQLVSGITITANGVDISGSQYVKIASGGYFQVTTGDFGIDTNVAATGYAIWSGASAAASSPFRVKKNGEVYLTKLVAVGENGTETEVNLRTANLWKLGYATIKSLTVADGYCTSITLSNAVSGSTTVNFKHAVPVNLTGSWSGRTFTVTETGSGETYSETPTYDVGTGYGQYDSITVNSYDANHIAWARVYQSSAQGGNVLFGFKVDASGQYSAGESSGYTSGWNDGKPTSVSLGEFIDGHTYYIQVGQGGGSHTDLGLDLTSVYNTGWIAGYNAAAGKFSVTGSTSGKITFPVTTSVAGTESTSQYDITADVTNPAQGYYMGIAYVNYIQRATRSRQFS